MRETLDSFEIAMPKGMRSYLRNYGYNFSRKACDFAAGMMRRVNPATGKRERIEPLTKEQAEEILQKNNVKLEHNEGYNFVYAANMIRADFWKSSIEDDRHLALMVRDLIDDPDNEGGNLFRRWLADCDARGTAVEWEDLL